MDWHPRQGTWNGEPFVWPIEMTGLRVVPICPDLLRYEQIGAADNWRGRVVRAFFWLMRAWPVKS